MAPARRPVVGIIGNSHLINDQYPAQSAGTMNLCAVAKVAACVPVIIPARPDYATTSELMALCDGFVFTGGRPNVHPEEYGEAETPAHGTFDRDRDRVTLPLIRALVEAGQPFLAICRGFQEMNVALGGTLHPEIRELPGRDNHRMPPDGTLEEKFALRHEVALTPGGTFAGIFGANRVMTNTLHGQGIVRAGRGVVIEGRAPDGTPEAIRVEGARGFALGVQWHPEYCADTDPVSRPLFEAFGRACADWASGRRPGRLREVDAA